MCSSLVAGEEETRRGGELERGEIERKREEEEIASRGSERIK